MAIQVDDLKTLKMYLDGVMNRAGHHAETVGAISLALIGAVLWKQDAKPIKVRSYAGSAANILWVTIGAKRYAIKYNHRKKCIEMRERVHTGALLHRFTNKTPVTDVYKAFDELKPKTMAARNGI